MPIPVPNLMPTTDAGAVAYVAQTTAGPMTEEEAAAGLAEIGYTPVDPIRTTLDAMTADGLLSRYPKIGVFCPEDACNDPARWVAP